MFFSLLLGIRIFEPELYRVMAPDIKTIRELVRNGRTTQNLRTKDRYQEKVLAVLRGHIQDIEYQIEADSGGIAKYDVYFPEGNLVIEIEGTTHYYGLSEELLPKYQLKRELLARAGIDVLYIEYQ
jgi:hypothetical protein